jgi:hypothetical protein
MPKHHPPSTPHDNPSPANATAITPAVAPGPQEQSFGNKALTVAAVGVAAALIETELIPGMLIGVAAMLAPNLLPKVGNGLRPLIKSAVRAGYSVTERAKETFAEAGEQLQDIVAEVKAEQNGAAHAAANVEHPATPAPPTSAPPETT